MIPGLMLILFNALVFGEVIPLLSPDEPEAAIKMNRSAVTRNGGTLTIRMKTGAVTFQDNPTNGEQASRSRFEGSIRLPSGRTDYFVHTFGWESQGYTVINGETGAKLTLVRRPALSPDRKHYLSSTFDIDAGYEQNNLSIYRVDTFEQVFSLNWDDREGKGPADAVWVSSKKVTFNETSNGVGGSYIKSPRSVVLLSGKWVVK